MLFRVVAIASLTVVVITLVVVWKNLRYLTGNLYFESPVEISFVPKHIREFLGLCSIEGGKGKYPKEIIIPTDKLPLDKECEIILYIRAKEKVSVRMIEVGFEGGYKAEIPEILGLSNGIVKKWIKEIPREIFITHWGWINVIFTIPKRLQKEEQGELFVGINVKIKKSGIYYLNVCVTSEEAEKYKFERLKVVVK
ncbi:MAG: hypothetical protein QMC80_01285 [Thermoplasmatales archaeon]|nr:hypothetical protein [Thermoplasmatales archaeon]